MFWKKVKAKSAKDRKPNHNILKSFKKLILAVCFQEITLKFQAI